MGEKMRTIEIDEETANVIKKYCEEFGETEDRTILNGLSFLNGRLKASHKRAKRGRSKSIQRKLTMDDRKEMLRLLANGIRPAEVARRFGITRQGVQYFKKRGE